LNGTDYCEDVSDDEEYGMEWVRQFLSDIIDSKTVIMVCDNAAQLWEFEGVWSIETAHAIHFLQVRMGKRIEPLASG
jgi:hypothetical protein